jgi:hypothetical protein
LARADGHSLVTFYRGESGDHAGRMIDEIWAFSLDELEDTHDFIQWLFPLPERSPVNPHAPVLDESTRAAFLADGSLVPRVGRSLQLMLDFYGLAMGDGHVVAPHASFAERCPNWLSPNNHNHLRLTRVVSSVSLLGLRDALLKIADAYPGLVTATTRRFWAGAVRAG